MFKGKVLRLTKKDLTQNKPTNEGKHIVKNSELGKLVMKEAQKLVKKAIKKGKIQNIRDKKISKKTGPYNSKKGLKN